MIPAFSRLAAKAAMAAGERGGAFHWRCGLTKSAKADAPIQPATRDASNNITSFYAAYRAGDLLGVGQFPSWTAHNLKADASALPASETWTFEVDDGQGGTTTVTKNVAVYAAGGNA